MTARPEHLPVVVLRLVRGGKVLRSYEFETDTVTIGTREGCTFRATGDPELLPVHATLHVEGNEITMVPEPGAEVLVNGKRVDVAVPRPTDEIHLGRLTLRVEVAASATRPSPPAEPPEPAEPARPPVTWPALVLRDPRGKDHPIKLKKGVFTIGRKGAHIRLPFDGIAERHVDIEVKADGSVVVVDRGSGEPSLIDGEPVTSAAFLPGSTLQVGPVRLTFAGAGPPLGLVVPEPEEEEEALEEELDAEPTAVLDAIADAEAEGPGLSTDAAAEAEAPAAPSEEGAPAARPEQAPPPGWWDEDDDDDELTFQAPFDMAAHLLQRTPPVTTGPVEPYCAVTVVRVAAGRVRESVGVVPGTPFRDLTGELTAMTEGGRVLLSATEGVDGEVRRGDERFALSILPVADGRRELTLHAGDSAVLTGSGGTWRVDAYQPRRVPRRGGFALGPGAVILLVVALLFHGAVALGMALVAPSLSLDEERAAEEVFAVLELEQPTETVPERAPAKVAPVDATNMAERPPDVSVKAIQDIRERPKSTDVDTLLAVLSRGSGTPGQTDELKDLVSNLDAVAPPSGSAGGFDIAGAIASLPGGEVNIARSGGGGAISTLSADEVSDKTLTDLGKAKKGTVRGNVTRMASAAKVQGSLSREEISRVVNEHIHQIQGCYERALMSDPTLSGRIVFDWTVTPQGSVTQVRVRSSTVGDSKVADCISELIRAWRFDKPAGGEVIVTYPFLFRSVAQ